MRIQVITAPAIEPVTLADVKLYTHISHTEEDSLITSWIKAGREAAESWQRTALITQTIEISFDNFPATPIKLPRSPVQSVTTIKYFDVEDTETTFSSDNYQLDIAGRPARIALAYGVSWPAVTLRALDAVRVRYIAGYGVAVTDVPQNTKDAILLYCAHRYENRSGEQEVPKAFYNLLDSERLPSYVC